MNYKVKGIIASIGEKRVLDNGAVVLDYIVNVTENSYVTPHKFDMYKKAEYAEHIDNFIKFNKVGDEVEVEFTIRGQEWKGKTYNSLNHWKCDKIGMSPVSQEGIPKQALEEWANDNANDLPF